MVSVDERTRPLVSIDSFAYLPNPGETQDGLRLVHIQILFCESLLGFAWLPFSKDIVHLQNTLSRVEQLARIGGNCQREMQAFHSQR